MSKKENTKQQISGEPNVYNRAAQTFGRLSYNGFVLRFAEVLPKRFVLLLTVPFTLREEIKDEVTHKQENTMSMRNTLNRVMHFAVSGIQERNCSVQCFSALNTKTRSVKTTQLLNTSMVTTMVNPVMEFH